IGGVAVVGDNDALAERLGFLQNAIGAIAAPFDSFLALRGVKTLALRMESAGDNALAIAQRLAARRDIRRVIYPGLESHPQHALARQQMRTGGAMVGVIVDGGLERSRRMLERCRIFTLAESLGGVESLIEHPAIMADARIPAA